MNAPSKITINQSGVYLVSAVSGLKFNERELSEWTEPLIPAGGHWMTRFLPGDRVNYPEGESEWLRVTVTYMGPYDWNGLDGSGAG